MSFRLTAALIVVALVAAACTRDQATLQSPEATQPSSRATAATQASTTTDAESAESALGLDRRQVPPFDAVAWHVERGLLSPDEVQIPTRPAASVGDTEVFLVSDETGTVEVTAELMIATEQAAMWVEQGVPIDPAELQFAATILERDIVPTLTDMFGPLPSPGVDGDGRVDILHLGTLGASAGEFGSGDLLPRAIVSDSNEREILYISLESTTVGSDEYLATLAHELQHLIDSGVRPNTPLWLAEGLAQLAERVAGYDSVGSDTEFLASRPVQLNSWGPLQLDTRHYGAAYLFTLYLWEQFGPAIASDIANAPYDGLAAVDAALNERDTSIEAVFADWIIANFLDRPDLDPRFGYENDALRPVCPVDDVEALPHVARDEVDQFAARYHVMEGNGNVTIRFRGDESTGPISDLPHRGLWMWWSGRSDNSAAGLTRAFDLSGTSRATLEFRIWHDTGLGDGAVVSVSTDAGETWTALAGRRSTPPTDRIPAPSYTGTSGRGEEAVWVGDEIDLSGYTGEEVLVRFEYITDLFENRSGMALDEIEIPEIGYVDGAEEGSDWEAEGFMRVPGTMDQLWTVRVVDPSAPDIVSDIEIVEGVGTLQLTLIDGEPVVIAIAPLTVGTAVPAGYELTIDGTASITPITGGIDDFTDPCGGWELENEADYSLRQTDGRLAIDLHEDQVFTWSTRDGYFEDVTVTATAEFGEGSGDHAAAGIMCRVSNNGFYDFEVSSDGFVFAGLALADTYTTFQDWMPHGAVNTGDGAMNDLSLECNGPQIRFSVNDTVVIEVEDDKLVGGEVALSGTSFDASGFAIYYEGVEITSRGADSDDLLTFDDFTDGPGSWSLEDNSRSVLEVSDGVYAATVRPADWYVEGFAGVDVNDVVVDLDVAVTENTPDGSMSLSCRNQPNGDQYLFLVGLDGYVSIAAYIGGEFETISGWELTSQISAAEGDLNHLQMRCVGSRLELAANGVPIATVEDDRLTGGDVGVGLVTIEHGNYEAQFDNVRIRRAS